MEKKNQQENKCDNSVVKNMSFNITCLIEKVGYDNIYFILEMYDNTFAKMITFPEKMTKIKLVGVYPHNAIIPMFPFGLKHIIIDSIDFNLKFQYIPSSVKSIKFINQFNADLPDLYDTKIKTLRFPYSFNGFIECFPRKLRKLIFGNDFTGKLLNLEYSQIKYLTFGNSYNRILLALPKTIKYINFGIYYNHPLPSLANTKLKYIVFNKSSIYNFPLIPPSGHIIKKVIFASNYCGKFENINEISFYFGTDLNHYLSCSSKIKIKVCHALDDKYYIYTYDRYDIQNLYNICNFLKEKLSLYKYNNNIFLITVYTDIIRISIKVILNTYLLYILYNNIYIPFEIYDYIYKNFNFILKN